MANQTLLFQGTFSPFSASMTSYDVLDLPSWRHMTSLTYPRDFICRPWPALMTSYDVLEMPLRPHMTLLTCHYNVIIMAFLTCPFDIISSVWPALKASHDVLDMTLWNPMPSSMTFFFLSACQTPWDVPLDFSIFLYTLKKMNVTGCPYSRNCISGSTKSLAGKMKHMAWCSSDVSCWGRG